MECLEYRVAPRRQTPFYHDNFNAVFPMLMHFLLFHQRGHRECQMKISIKSQTVLKRGQEKPYRLFKDQKKAKLYLSYFHAFVTKKFFNYKNIKKYLKLRLSLAWHCTGAHY